MRKIGAKSIVTVDIYNNTQYKYSNGKFFKLVKLKKSKKDILVSYIANKDLIIEPVELSPNLPQDSLVDIVTDKVYEEQKLDPAVEYKVFPIKTAIHSNLIKYQTLIVDSNKLKEKFKPLSKKTKIIDYIIPAPLLYNVLFQEKYVDSSSSYIFIHFGDYDTFITFYHKGEYLYSKSIKFSLEEMHNRFTQLAQEEILSLKKFRELISNYGLKDSNPTHKELLIRVINECFLKINEVVIYTKRAYNIDSFKTAFVSFDWGYIDGIELYIKNYLNIDGKSLVTLYSKDDPKVAISPMHSLMRLSTIAAESGILDIPNLTPYPKPKPLFKRAAGKMITIFFTTVLLFMIPVIYDYVVGTTFKTKNLILEPKERKLTAEAKRYKQILTRKREEVKALDSAIDKISKVYNRKKGQLVNVYNKKFSYKLRSEQLALITKILKEYDIKSRDIKIDDALYSIEIESKDDEKITAFIKSLVKRFDNSISSVNIEKIKFDNKDQLYKGTLAIEFSKDLYEHN